MRLKIPRLGRRATRRKPARSTPTTQHTPTYRNRTQLKWGPEGRPARTREQLADRYARTPVQGIRQTPLAGHPDHGRNWPARGNLRRQDATAGARAQLAARDRQRTAQGLPQSQPHPRTTRHPEGAHAKFQAAGIARRPASRLPGDPTPVAAGQAERRGRRPVPGQLSGFAAKFFGAGNTSPIGRPPR